MWRAAALFSCRRAFSAAVPQVSPSPLGLFARTAHADAFNNTASGFLSPKRSLQMAASSAAKSEKPAAPAPHSSSVCGCGTDHSGEDWSLAPREKGAGDWSLEELLAHNQAFVTSKEYRPLLVNRFPFKKVVVVTCMDTRLTELLPQALDLKNGDAKIIKVAGAMVAHPFGSVMRSILVAVYALGAQHIVIVGHHDCGMTGLDGGKILQQARQRGVPDTTFKTLSAAGLNLNSWLTGFESVASSVLHSVDTVRNHPLLLDTAPALSVHGLIICPTTGKLDLLTAMRGSAGKKADK
eukprot:gnl/Hemi2/21907_TR7319_c0_g1_i1.p1 gnl/Hemi2/21907_TR7319_c0_g1~~gnl/Hemi2/21907_TR7319_c0_g1_i1.p1  ORF type:complete len:347 (-),score=74.41 gnl/Hemi2/21907_TR7319_c0_g1_i1:111-995(-)